MEAPPVPHAGTQGKGDPFHGGQQQQQVQQGSNSKLSCMWSTS